MITICSVAFNDQTTDLFGHMVQSVLKFTPNPKFIVIDNGNNDLSAYEGRDNFDIRPCKANVRGSLQHGISLNVAFGYDGTFEKIKTEYTAIVESDVVVLRDDWWKTDHDLKAAIKVDAWHHICLLVGKTSLLQNIDWRPNDSVGRSFQPHEDVGFRLSNHAKDVELMHFVDCKGPKAKLFKGLQSDEFHDQNGNVLASHWGRGSNIGGKANRKGFPSHQEQLKKWKAIAQEAIK